MKKNKNDRIWDEASTLRPEDLSETKVHVTLRVDPRLYRKILEEQKRSRERTVTATIERILRSSFEVPKIDLYMNVLAALRNVVAHSLLQDDVIRTVAEGEPADANVQKLLTEQGALRTENESLERLIESLKKGARGSVGRGRVA